MSSIIGEHLKLSIFGQSHGSAIGMTLDGVSAGLPIDEDALLAFLKRRAPGQNAYSTPRSETDAPEFLSGVVDGFTCGAPITAVIYNKNTKSQDYKEFSDCPRPGHADYTAHIKYQDHHDIAGGGHFSGRLTAPLCIAGGLCKQWLSMHGIEIRAHIASIGSIADSPVLMNEVAPDLAIIQEDFPVINPDAGEKMKQSIEAARLNGDSVGGTITCYITGVPAGYGGPLFSGVEGKLAQMLYGIPAVKGVEFGSGFYGSTLYGSENNDAFTVTGTQVTTKTNHAGGILGGITNGMPIFFRTAIKPTPSISKPQTTVNLQTMTEQIVQICGRHDPCIVPRAVPVVEAAAAFAIYDILLSGI